jgi:hypothetical protein
VKSEVLKEITIYYYLVRCDAVRSGIRGFKLGSHWLLEFIDETFSRTEGDKPRSTLLEIARNLVIFTCLFNDVASN